MIPEVAAVVVVVLVAAVGVGLRLRDRLAVGRRVSAAALVLALLLLAFVPFSSHVFGDVEVVRVVAVDVSRSMADVERVLTPGAWGDIGTERVIVVSFGARADLLHDGAAHDLPASLRPPGSALTPLARRAARLDEALRLVGGRLAGAPFALTVVSDGGYDGAAAALALDDRARPAAVELVAPPQSRWENVGLRFVTPPVTASSDAPVDVEVEVHGRVLVARTVVVEIEGASPREVVLTPTAGAARLRARVPPLGPGVTGIAARLGDNDWDRDRDDNAARLPVHVRRTAPRVVVVTTAPAAASAELADALGARIDPAPDLAAVDVVVLHECDATRPLVDDAALRDFVGGGGGLLLAGSRSSFGPGDWDGTVADALSPLAARPSGRRVVTVALDRSGSMERDGRFKSAARAVAALAESLGGEDRLRLIPFGADAPVHDLAASDGAGPARAVLDRIRPTGGTDLGRALDAALDFEAPEGGESVVVLLTDARDPRAMRPARLDAWRRAAAERGHVLQVLWFDRDEALRPLLLRLVDGDDARLVAIDDFSRLVRPMLDSARRGLAIDDAPVTRLGAGMPATVDRLVRTTTRPEARVRSTSAPGLAALAECGRGAGRVAAAPVTLDGSGIAALFGDSAALRRFTLGLASSAPDGPEAIAVEEYDGGWRYRVTGRSSPAALVIGSTSVALRRVGRDSHVSKVLREPPPSGVVAITDRDGMNPVRRPVAAPDLLDRHPLTAAELPLDLKAPESPFPTFLALAAFAAFLTDATLRLLGR